MVARKVRDGRVGGKRVCYEKETGKIPVVLEMFSVLTMVVNTRTYEGNTIV